MLCACICNPCLDSLYYFLAGLTSNQPVHQLLECCNTHTLQYHFHPFTIMERHFHFSYIFYTLKCLVQYSKAAAVGTTSYKTTNT